MKRALALIAAVLGLVESGTALAGGAFTGRVGAAVGNYSIEDELIDRGCCGSPGATLFESDYSTEQYGLLAGIGLNVARFFVDVGIEYAKFADDADADGDGVEDTAYYRSDFLFTLGVFIGDHFTIFGGYRNATLGDGFFSEDLGYTTYGPFLGGGVSFRMGDAFSLGTSAAYNVLTYSKDGVAYADEIDLDGFSIKAQGSFLGTPHSIFLRWQRFTGEESVPLSYEYEQTEDYLSVGYQATFDFASW